MHVHKIPMYRKCSKNGVLSENLATNPSPTYRCKRSSKFSTNVYIGNLKLGVHFLNEQ